MVRIEEQDNGGTSLLYTAELGGTWSINIMPCITVMHGLICVLNFCGGRAHTPSAVLSSSPQSNESNF